MHCSTGAALCAVAAAAAAGAKDRVRHVKTGHAMFNVRRSREKGFTRRTSGSLSSERVTTHKPCHSVIGHHTQALPFRPRPRPRLVPRATMHGFADSRLFVLSTTLLMLVAMAVVPMTVSASTVASGCAGAASATESNGFFTLSGSTISGANGCYVMNYDDGEASPGSTCTDACALAGLGCASTVVSSATADCTAALDWYLGSSAKHTDVPASPAAGSHTYCGFQSFFGGAWRRSDQPMPSNKNLQCSARRFQGPALHVAACKCNDPIVDTTAPTLSSIATSQTSPSSVTVTGSVDEGATVYCTIGASGDVHTPASVKAAGFTDVVGSAGSFSVTVTGVSGDGTKSVACVGEDAANNLGSSVSAGADFHFGTRCRRCTGTVCLLGHMSYEAHRAI